ncbi:hypothetical protein GJA_522 [Janthinobacterium agaricidamnosum NBRC 102515 = DSM 9628]|uniref:Uncharacterized protein n=1 Tax=Janthinobacterium agaricidamnosum NBRC 102515 = DSM 9628 TaxID=1349767 RepID=W0V1M8_9BURK|nr:hypothetical protein GJA_522 [Janthinobacterium agaricidamnosum NBRC 102515 = DSM 9628]
MFSRQEISSDGDSVAYSGDLWRAAVVAVLQSSPSGAAQRSRWNPTAGLAMRMAGQMVCK